MNTKDISDREIVAEFFERIDQRDEEAAFDLAQFCLPRIVEGNFDAMLDTIEGLSRASANLGSPHAQAFLSEDWTSLRAILLRRLRRSASKGKTQ